MKKILCRSISLLGVGKLPRKLNLNLLLCCFDKLEVPASNRGNVVIKENSVDLAIESEKFIPDTTSILIDDLVDKYDE